VSRGLAVVHALWGITLALAYTRARARTQRRIREASRMLTTYLHGVCVVSSEVEVVQREHAGVELNGCFDCFAEAERGSGGVR
jgi:hypothetical protein